MTTSKNNESQDQQTVELFTDGACLGNPGPGGWAYLLRHPVSGKSRQRAGGELTTTNNRMELMAVIRGLAELKERSTVHLCADSQYVLKGIKEWMPGWKARGWRKADKKPVLNADLWQELDELLQQHDVHVTWTRGHAGHAENELCDQLASAEAEKFQRQARLARS